MGAVNGSSVAPDNTSIDINAINFNYSNRLSTEATSAQGPEEENDQGIELRVRGLKSISSSPDTSIKL